MLIQILCDSEVDPWTRQLGCESLNTDAIVWCDAAFQELGTHLLQLLQQEEVCSL